METDNTQIYREKRQYSFYGAVITVFDGKRPPRRIDLEKYSRECISFGRGKDNDIILQSRVVSRKHGYFSIRKNGIEINAEDSTNYLILNGICTKRCILRGGDILRIDGSTETLDEGVLILLQEAGTSSKWEFIKFPGQGHCTIGRAEDCTIRLSHVGVSKHHALLEISKDGVYIKDTGSMNGVFINGKRLSSRWKLCEKDIIQITNTKFIYTAHGLFCCNFRNGFGIEVEDMVRIVKNGEKKIAICDHVSLSIAPGELVAIIGGSGAGKTTLMNGISGYDPPTSGKVWINGDNLYKMYGALKNIIGYVPQQDIVYDNLTLEAMLMYAAKLRLPDDMGKKERMCRVKDVIRIVELDGKEHTMISRLSGGQKKRASIAVELLSDPNLFFLDEPASGLDPGTERNLMKTLKQMAQSGKTILLVTHSTLNLQECDKIIFMGKGGKLCYCGDMEGAKRFFQVDNLVDVYNMIAENSEKWSQKYESVRIKKQYDSSREKQQGKWDRPKRHSAVRQTWLLSERYARLLWNDRKRFLMVLIQAPVLALLISFVKDGEQFETYSISKSLLFALSCSAFWLGILNAIQEVCKERTILKREYMTGLGIGSYIVSKFFVLGALCTIQSFLLTGVFCIFVGLPKEGVWLLPALEFGMTTFATSFAAMGMGIFASSLFKNPDRAMTVAPLLLLPQILFSGLLFELKGVTKYISWFAVCRWSMEGYGTTANLNSLPKKVEINGDLMEIEQSAESFFTFTAKHLREDLMILLVIAVGFGVLSGIILKTFYRMKKIR